MLTKNQKISYGILGTAFVVGVGLFLGWMVESHRLTGEKDAVATITEGRTIGTAQLGGPFELVDHHGAPRSDGDFRGRYMLVYFGYRFCPDICPAALYNITEALNQLGKTAAKIQPLFITVDPKRDTAENLGVYMQNYDPRFIALTGNENQIETAKKAYKVFALPATPDGTTSEYLMDHSSIIYLMDPMGRFVAHFNHTTEPKQLAAALNRYVH